MYTKEQIKLLELFTIEELDNIITLQSIATKMEMYDKIIELERLIDNLMFYAELLTIPRA